jgi:hypothetical protein
MFVLRAFKRLFFGSTSASGEWKAITVGGGAQDFEAHDEGLNGLAMSHDVRNKHSTYH